MSHLKLVTPKKHLIRESYDDFILSRQAMLRTPKTIQFYEYTVGGFVGWLNHQGINEPKNIKSLHVRAFLAETAKRGVKDSTIHAFARGSRAFVRFLYGEGYVEKPIKVSMPKVAKKRLPLLTIEEF